MSGVASLFIPDPQGLLIPTWPEGVADRGRLELMPDHPRTLVEKYAYSPDKLQQFYTRDDEHGHYMKSRAHLMLHLDKHEVPVQQKALAFLRDHVHHGIPRAYYRAFLGHDLHISTFAMLHAQQYHAHLIDPFTGRLGWWENLGLVSPYKVTVAFRDFEIDQLQTATSAYGTFKYHEVGTDATAETNAQTALIVTTGIARVAGTQTEVAADQYRSVATITADSTETWQEHGLFNASSGVTMMDRNLISPTVAVVNLDTVQFTFTLTKNAEA